MANIAIACQGGGSHTAFTAGVLRTAIPWIAESDHRLVGLSGTSGGAVSAVAAWYGLLSDGPAGVTETLDGVWGDIAASNPLEEWVNDWIVQGMRLHHGMAPSPTFSPYDVPSAKRAEEELRAALERHVEFDRFEELVRSQCPRLVVGTVDVNAGEFETFEDEQITADSILASSAVPTLFQAVEIDGHYHWDGLFSQNPPIHELLQTAPEDKPDELWVVQINPQTYEGEPRRVQDIVDRRNELAGNLSLNQELRFVETVNRWLARGDLPEEEYRHTEIRRLKLDKSLDYTSKLDRNPEFLEELTAAGIETTERFLEDVDIGGHSHEAQIYSSHSPEERPEDVEYD